MHWRFENKKYKYLNLVLNNIKAYKLLIYFIYYKKYCPCLYLMYQSVAQSQKSAIKNLCPFPVIARPRFIEFSLIEISITKLLQKTWKQCKI